MQSVRRLVSLCLLVLILATSICRAQEKKPINVVIVFVDDMGYGDVGCFGATDIDTPNVDRIAKEGVRFTDFYVTQPVCSASRAGLLTGCYSNRVGIHSALGPKSPVGLSTDETTVANMLKDKGYATAMVGKWHLGDHPSLHPMKHGFDSYFGLLYSNDMWRGNINNRNYPDLTLFDGDKPVVSDLTEADQSQLTTLYTEHAVKFVHENKDKPFFLYLAHSMPHCPIYVSSKFKDKSRRGLYGDVIEEIDWSVGQVMDALKADGNLDNTLIVFTSDNGPWRRYGNHAGSAGPLREGKGNTFEGGIREPFVARLPGVIPAGVVQKTPAMTIDLLPTIAGLTGAKLPEKKIDGLDILPLLQCKEGATSPHEAYYFYYGVNNLEAIRSGQWKLIFPHVATQVVEGHPVGKDGKGGTTFNMGVPLSLYDLENDIGETKNVIADHPDVVERLQKLADKAREDLGDDLTKVEGSGRRKPAQVGKW